MTREQIEQAAKETVQDLFQCNGKYPCEERNYCEFCNGHNSAFDCKEDCGADDFNEGFIAGAQWRINSVWHDVSEEPKEHKLVLIEDDFCGEPDYGVWQAPFPNWEDSIVHFSSKRWAYLDDLLPERKEEAK